MEIVKPLVSIALCTYNGEQYLKEQLDSLVKQDYPNLEIIAVDDRSKDSTAVILNGYSHQYPNIKVYINEVNLGYKKNFEKAIQLCKGEYIALSDQDDIWVSDKISKLIVAIKDAVLIYHDSLLIDHNGTSLNKKMSDILNMYQGNNFKPFLISNCISGHACLFKKQFAEKTIPFPEKVMHDQWLAFCAANLGNITYLNESLVKYRQHENTDTNILRFERKKISKKISGREKVINISEQLDAFHNFRHNKDQKFIKMLRLEYLKNLNSYLSPKLVFVLYKHLRLLLYIHKKSTVSKINFVYKHLWGLKLKS